MAYAQKNYDQQIGNSDETIAQSGALLVAYANLFDALGYNHDPFTLMLQLAEKGFEVSTGLYLGLVSLVEPTVSVESRGFGAPTETASTSIVRLEYPSELTGGTVVTYAYVENAAEHLIVDSYDGEIKDWDIYGGPKAFVTFTDDHAIPLTVTPLKAATVPAPAEVPQIHPYILVTALNGYKTPEDAELRQNIAASFAPGNYIDITDQDATAMRKIAPTANGPSYWINPADNVVVSDTPDPVDNETPQSPATDEDTTVPVRVITKDPEAWKSTWKPFLGPVPYYSTRTASVVDQDGEYGDVEITEGVTHEFAGWFIKDDVKYLRTAESFKQGNWYGVPESLLKRFQTDEQIDNLINDAGEELTAGKDGLKLPARSVSRLVAKAGTADGTLRRFFKK